MPSYSGSHAISWGRGWAIRREGDGVEGARTEVGHADMRHSCESKSYYKDFG